MRVLQVLRTISSRSGGPPRSMLATCNAIYEADPDLHITLSATNRRLDPAWHKKFVQQLPPGVQLQLFSAVGRHTFIFSISFLRWLRDHAAGFDLVVIRGLFHPIGSMAAMIARRQGVPYVLTPLGSLSHYTFEHRRTLLKRMYFRLINRRILAGAAAVRFTSPAEREEAPIDGISVMTRVIPHPYESDFELVGEQDRNSGQILFLSRLHPKKGIDILLQALSRVRQELPGAQLVLAGSGADRYERRVAQKIRRLRLDGAVERPGFVGGTEKRDLLAHSAVLVLPSHQENFGVAVVEAMDAGLPVIISRGVQIWPEVEEAGAGIVVQERTAGAVADALLTLLGDDVLRKEMGQNGHNLVRSAYDPMSVGQRLCELYRLAAGRRSPTCEVAN